MDWPRVKINDNMAGKIPRETAIIAPLRCYANASNGEGSLLWQWASDEK